MKIRITPIDVEKAINHANGRPLLGMAQQHRDIADYLNRTLNARYRKRWRAVGFILEAEGIFACLAGLMLVLSEDDFLVPGLLAVVLGFIAGIIGWGITDGGHDG